MIDKVKANETPSLNMPNIVVVSSFNFWYSVFSFGVLNNFYPAISGPRIICCFILNDVLCTHSQFTGKQYKWRQEWMRSSTDFHRKSLSSYRMLYVACCCVFYIFFWLSSFDLFFCWSSCCLVVHLFHFYENYMNLLLYIQYLFAFVFLSIFCFVLFCFAISPFYSLPLLSIRSSAYISVFFIYTTWMACICL